MNMRERVKKNKKSLVFMMSLCLLFTFMLSVASGNGEMDDGGGLLVENGLLQPVMDYSNPRDPGYSNEDSEILRYCVYVETDHDTDGDGMADLVKVLVQVPRSAVEGNYQAAVIYDPTPYNAGTVEEFSETYGDLYVEGGFDYARLYLPGEKRIPAGEMDTMSAAMEANASVDWNYTVPYSNAKGYTYLKDYDYFLVRGYAVVMASGIGTYGSEGFELCGSDLERDCHKNVVEWLTGDRVAYTDRTHDIQISADWCNGNVAMTGCSYGGTLPFEVATTGVKGLKTIIPFAGIANWYDYTNSQGVVIISETSYTDSLASYNCGGTFLDDDWTVPNEDYGSWMWQISQDEDEANGDYTDVWARMNYAHDTENIQCSALIVQGLNDFNVTTRQADLMYKAFAEAGAEVKMVLHQDGHNVLNGRLVGGELWEEVMNRWLSHYLYGIDNGAEEMPAVLVQSNLDGTYAAYDSWLDMPYMDCEAYAEGDTTNVSTVGLAEYATQFLSGENRELSGLKGKELYYVTLPEDLGGLFAVGFPEGETIYGTPEVHVKLSTDATDKDGLMITAVLIDVAQDYKTFKAYMTKDRLGDTLPIKTIDFYDIGTGAEGRLVEYVRSSTNSKCITFGWTDLCNPGLGNDAREYTGPQELQAGEWYDYTFYMLPTAYTLEKGHQLLLLITAWDPYRAFLDEDYKVDPSMSTPYSFFNYSFAIDHNSLNVQIPVPGK